MIPTRLALRAATVKALTRGGVAPYPTMAGDAVFDSRLAPITEFDAGATSPIIIVYTSTDRRKNIGGKGQRSWLREIDLIIEIAIGSIGKKGDLRWIETDAAMEATLDLFEAEVEMALNAIDNPYAIAWRSMVKEIKEWDSEPYRDNEKSMRYAVRQIAISCELAIDCPPRPTLDQDDVPPIGDDPLIPIDYLQPLEAALRANEAMFGSTLKLLSGQSRVTLLPRMERIHFSRAGAAGPNGEDGTPSLEATVEIGDAP